MQSAEKSERKRKRKGWFKSFLRTLRPQLFLLAVMLIVFGLLMLFTHVPINLYWYGVQLSLFFWFLSAVVQWIRYVKRAEKAEHIHLNDAESFADSVEEGDAIGQIYLDKYSKLAEEYHAFKQREADKSKEQMDYFTLWLHQIKTPIAGMSLILQRQEDDSAEKKQMEQELLRLNDYTHMALNYLKLEDSGKEMDLEEVPVDAVIKDTMKKYAILFIYNKIQLEYEPLEMTVLSDRKWLQVLLEQIVSNSLKYTKAGKIRIYAENDHTLVVEDTGSGIRKEDLPKIFEKGYTGLSGRLHEKSTGLGLFLSRKICERLGHQLKIESEAGEGTKAFLIFTPSKLMIFD